MDLSVSTGIPVLTVFIQGLLSFFSPCVLPLLPVYIGYLSGGTLKRDEEGNLHYDRKKVLLNTVFFVIGVSFAFFLLGIGLSAIGRFFHDYQMVFTVVGGAIVILFGLYQLGVFGTGKLLSQEKRLPFRMDKMAMSPLTALIFGFVLSFAWSPCIGPVLSSVLVMAAAAGTMAAGLLLIGVYTLGYIVPFLLVGIFTTSLLEFFSRHRNVVRYTVKIGGVILIIMGVLMLTGQLNGISSYLSTISGGTQSAVTEEVRKEEAPVPEATPMPEVTGEPEVTEEPVTEGTENDPASEADEQKTDEQEEVIWAYDFTLTDQYGNSHTLSDYQGKIVFINFWATWCPPCREELPYIQELYEEYSKDPDSDVVFLTVTFPGVGKEQNEEGITQFAEENGYTFPVLMDTEGSLVMPYYISAYPTTFIIEPDGSILGYVPGGMTKDIMTDVINQAREHWALKYHDLPGQILDRISHHRRKSPVSGADLECDPAGGTRHAGQRASGS